jgi:hypothetical protein
VTSEISTPAAVCTRTADEERAALAEADDSTIAGDQASAADPFGPPLRALVRGSTIHAADGMKRLYKL